MGGVGGLNVKMGGHDHAVAVSVMVIMIVMTMQLPSTSNCAMYNQISTSRSAGNATWCDGHINMDGECIMQLNTKTTNNIPDGQEDDLDWGLDLQYAMVNMVEYYSETTFYTRFLKNAGEVTTNAVNKPGQPICGTKDAQYSKTCLPKKNVHQP